MKRSKKCIWFDLCPLKNFYEQGKLDKKWIANYCFGKFSKCTRYKMEQEDVYHPDNMMPDGTIDERIK